MRTITPLNIFLMTLCFQSSVFGSVNNTVKDTILKSENIQIVYFSKTGNTERIAKYIQEVTGGTLIKINTKTPYPEDYTKTTKIAKKEVKNEETPEIVLDKKYLENTKIIFVGSPCWWGTIASPVRTFLTTHNFEEKTIIPFITHGGSELGETVETIKVICPKANVKYGKAFGDPKWINIPKDQKAEVKNWIDTIDFPE